MFSMIYTISCDSYLFFKKQIINIIILSALCAFFTIIIQYMIGPNLNEISILYETFFLKKYTFFQILHKITNEQKKIILHIFCVKTLSLLINHTALYTAIIFLIKSIISKKQKNLYHIIKKSIHYLPIVLPLIFLKFFITEVGFIFFKIPGIILSILLPLSPVLLLIENQNILSSLKNSILISWENIYVIIFPILVWNFLKWILITLFVTLYIFPVHMNIFIINFLLNFGYSYIAIYLFRFNALIKVKNVI
ncbi:YciC family protein [Buchnera aphidicola]|uniref:YciC family protein n=1 Tax=Buchnera aphidicola TaxID=9 RepID=UPI00094DD4DE|nr:YciC family protein [Buchnera aphidicola]